MLSQHLMLLTIFVNNFLFIGMLSTALFIEKSKKIHNNLYDYDLVDYKKSIINVDIICNQHGVFKQTPHNHLKGRGCPKCSGNIRLSTDEFINKAYKKYGNKYDYSKVNYVNGKTKITIICYKHGEFEQIPDNHLKACGCLKCRKENLSNLQKKSIETFKKDCLIVHNNKYNYDNAI